MEGNRRKVIVQLFCDGNPQRGGSRGAGRRIWALITADSPGFLLGRVGLFIRFHRNVALATARYFSKAPYRQINGDIIITATCI